MKKPQWLKLIISVLLVILCCAKPGNEINTIKIQNEIQSLMDHQKKSWNEGNIEGFMAYYWNSENFTFQSGNKRLQGWNKLLAMYQENYSGENMGKLDFTDIEIDVLSNDFAYVLGRWKVTTMDTSKEGLFTLIFKKFDVGWRIIVDHSS